MKIISICLSVLVCMLLSGCEEDQDPQPGPEEREQLRESNGPGLVNGHIGQVTKTGTINVGLTKTNDNDYAFGEFVSGDEAYYVVISREVWERAGLKANWEDGVKPNVEIGYVGKHTVVIADQEEVKLIPHDVDIYEIISIDE